MDIVITFAMVIGAAFGYMVVGYIVIELVLSTVQYVYKCIKAKKWIL